MRTMIGLAIITAACVAAFQSQPTPPVQAAPGFHHRTPRPLATPDGVGEPLEVEVVFVPPGDGNPSLPRLGRAAQPLPEFFTQAAADDTRKIIVLEEKGLQQVSGDAGRVVWMRLSIEPKKDEQVEVGWASDVDADKADFWATDGGRTVLFNCPTPGTYSVRYYVVRNGKGSPIRRVDIVLKGVTPPVPPVPPTPPVPPSDPLYASFQSAYLTDTSPTKALTKTNLAAGYIAVANNLADVKTWGNLGFVIGQMTQRQAPGDNLRPVKEVVAADWSQTFQKKADNEALTDGDKAAVKERLTRYGTLLRSIPD